jgi:hypothetical protein
MLNLYLDASQWRNIRKLGKKKSLLCTILVVPMYILDDLLEQVVIWDLFDLIVVSSP